MFGRFSNHQFKYQFECSKLSIDWKEVQFFNFQHALVHWTSLLAKEMNTIDLFWKGYTEPPWIEEIVECLVEKPLTDKGLNNKKIATFSVTLYCKLKYGITIYLFCFYTLDKSTRK